jgi:hypothetical protein
MTLTSKDRADEKSMLYVLIPRFSESEPHGSTLFTLHEGVGESLSH